MIAISAPTSGTIDYSFDARGGLVKVRPGGSVNNNFTVYYAYDKADNRTNVNLASPAAPP
jgi:hypothetical protein